MNGRDGSWLWRNDDSSVSWTNWKSGQPNKNEPACAVLEADDDGYWDDHDCDSHTEDGYICENPGGTVAPPLGIEMYSICQP